MRARLSALALAPLLAGCERDPVDVDCGADDVGDLVITELRGPQSGTDSYGEWLELYNASGAAVRLTGVRVSFTRLDGSSSSAFVIRDRTLQVEAGGHVVLGRFRPGQEPDHIDHGYADELDSRMPTSAALSLESCGQLIDRVIYRSLPSRGTLSFDGDSFPPDHLANDEEGAWCVDAVEDASTPEHGVSGTPRQRNRPCS
jgi:hypothetical protein